MVIIWFLVSFIKFAFGELREIERIVFNFINKFIKNVIDRAKRKILDIALILLIFREDLEIEFIGNAFPFYYYKVLMIQYISISFVHWVAIKRSEFVYTYL